MMPRSRLFFCPWHPPLRGSAFCLYKLVYSPMICLMKIAVNPIGIYELRTIFTGFGAQFCKSLDLAAEALPPWKPCPLGKANRLWQWTFLWGHLRVVKKPMEECNKDTIEYNWYNANNRCYSHSKYNYIISQYHFCKIMSIQHLEAQQNSWSNVKEASALHHGYVNGLAMESIV